MITDEMKVAAVKAYTEVDGKCRPAAMQKALEAALPFLPIAVEGKEPLDWEDPVTRAKVIYRARQLWNEDQFSCAWSDENREHYMIRAAFELAPSSPGKDGGQEVEAVEWQGRYWIEDEGRWSNWITNPVGYPWAHEPQEGRSEIRYLYPQPASTALVEALEPFSRAAGELYARNWNASQVVMSFSTEDGIVQLTASDFFAARSALSASQSTSREGER